jgi:hypothetical protein
MFLMSLIERKAVEEQSKRVQYRTDTSTALSMTVIPHICNSPYWNNGDIFLE